MILNILSIIFSLLIPTIGICVDYHVGAGQAITTLSGISWSSLQAGDTVYIHPGTYHEKINISGQGTESNPIRVIGVLDGDGNRPVINGENATTPSSADYRWTDPALVQINCLVSIMPSASLLPTWVEIKNLEITGARVYNTFTAENGSIYNYGAFASGIYIRSVQHVLLKNCYIHNNNLGIYNWTGSGDAAYDGLSSDLIISGNNFINNGRYQGYGEHQIYTEALRTTIEYNHFGPNTSGAYGSQIKDRSGGTIIRYNYFDENSELGWMIDLVEPENGWDAIGTTDLYKQTFVYGNIFRRTRNHELLIHWNGDNAASTRGRAVVDGGKLLFYNNTVIDVSNSTDVWDGFYRVVSSRGGSGDCLTQEMPGVVDMRNNIFASQAAGSNGYLVPLFDDCDNANHVFGKNFATIGYGLGTVATRTGEEKIISGATAGFVTASDYHLAAGSAAINAAETLPIEATNNYLGLDLTPNFQYMNQSLAARNGYEDLGAFDYTAGSTPSSGNRYKLRSITQQN